MTVPLPRRWELAGPDGETPGPGIPGYLKPGMEPFDPLSLAELTQPVVCRGEGRKYTRFHCVGVYGGISTGYAVGCNLRCVFCWVGLSRDFPHRHGRLCSAEETARNLVDKAKRRGLEKIRISGGEPTLCRRHLLKVLELTRPSGMRFILETNGVLLGADESYVRELGRFSHIHLRLSLKAGNGAGWEARTGAKKESFELPYRAIRFLVGSGVRFHVAAMTDPALMPGAERQELLDRLEDAGYRDWVEEEACYAYDLTLLRLRESGFKASKS